MLVKEPLLSPQFFKHNREALRSAVSDTDLFVLSANGLLQRNNDTTFPFRQDSSFKYYTGIDEPDIVLVMDKDTEYLIVPGRSGSRQAFDGAVDMSVLAEVSGVKDIFDEDEGWKKLEQALRQAKSAATLLPAPGYVESHGFYTNPARRRLVRRCNGLRDSLEWVDVRLQTARLRSVKQDPELAVMRQAIALTQEAITSVKRNGLHTYAYEYGIEADITAIFLGQGAQHAYTPIVAAGKNACTLHYVHNRAAIQTGGLVLMDVGAEVDGYAADITRTLSVTEPTDRQRQIHQAVMHVRKHALALLKPGVLLRDYEKQVESQMAEALQNLGLIKSADHDAVRAYYPHATSHFLGLDVHDVADYEQPLKPGMVLTVEPGIYAPAEEIGIRIEDDVLITESGNEVLSGGLPTDLA